MEFIDFHAHLHPTLEARERLLRKMNEVGIVRTLVVAGGVVNPNQLAIQMKSGKGKSFPVPNRLVAELCAQTENRLLPFYFANTHEGANEYRQTAERFYGLKIAPAVHGIPLLDSRHVDFITVAQFHRHPVYLHCLSQEGFDISCLVSLAQKYPKVDFVLGHAGIGNCDFDAVQLISSVSNIYFETSGGFSSVIAYAVKHLGMDRILFGTEYPLQAPEVELSKMQCLNLEAAVLNRNAARLLGARYVW